MNKKIYLSENQFNFFLKEMTNAEINKRTKDINTKPTDSQKEAGNYKMAHVTFGGFKITIENAKGSKRYWKDENGKTGFNEMKNHYGYFSNSLGHDGDHIDVFLGSNQKSDKVYVVDQNKEDGSFDESKVMLGFDSKKDAKEAYLSNFSKDWKGFRKITGVSKKFFKKWLYDGKKQRKPFSEYVDVLKKKLNESNKKKNILKEDYSLIENAYNNNSLYGLFNEFEMDKSKGVQHKKWNLIPKEPYWNALTNYMQYGEAFRTPERLIDSWLELIAENTVTLSHMTEIFGHSMCYPTDELIDIFFYEREDEAPQDYEGWCEFLEELGFFDWCILPDGSDAISDYGIEPIFKILNNLKSDATKGEKLIAVNRCLDIVHCRGDLSSAFIEGGRKTCSEISNN